MTGPNLLGYSKFDSTNESQMIRLFHDISNSGEKTIATLMHFHGRELMTIRAQFASIPRREKPLPRFPDVNRCC